MCVGIIYSTVFLLIIIALLFCYVKLISSEHGPGFPLFHCTRKLQYTVCQQDQIKACWLFHNQCPWSSTISKHGLHQRQWRAKGCIQVCASWMVMWSVACLDFLYCDKLCCTVAVATLLHLDFLLWHASLPPATAKIACMHFLEVDDLGQFTPAGPRHFVLRREVVLSSEVKCWFLFLEVLL